MDSNFNNKIAEEGYFIEIDKIRIQHFLAIQIQALMQEQGISKAELARRILISPAALSRLLDLNKREAVSIQTMARAALILGKHLRLILE